MTATAPTSAALHAPIWLRKELLAQGFDDRAIAQSVRAGGLHRVRRGAYVTGATLADLDTSGRHVLATRAVVKQSKTEVVPSHISALAVWGAPTWDLPLDVVDITRRDAKAGRSEAGVRQHRGQLAEDDVVVRDGLEVTAASRTVLDCICALDTEHGLMVVNHFLHEGLTTEADLKAGERAMRFWPDSLGLQHVLRLADARCESVGESRTLYLIFNQQLPPAVPQYEVHGPHGGVVARLDFAWPEHKVWLEFDGRVKYEKLLRPGESAADVVIREKQREELVAGLTGWRCIRITWADLASPVMTAARIRAMLAVAA